MKTKKEYGEYNPFPSSPEVEIDIVGRIGREVVCHQFLSKSLRRFGVTGLSKMAYELHFGGD